MSKSRILIFIDWFLPGYKAGGPVQSCANLIEHLKGEFDFSVVTRDTDYCESQPYKNVVSDAWNRVNNHLQVYYISEREISYNIIAKVAREANPDIIFINGIYSLYFSILPLLISRKFSDAKIIVSARGMLAPSAVNVKGGKKKLFLRLAKALTLYQDVCFHATSQAEEAHIRNFFGQKQPVKVAPNLPKNYTQVAKSLAKHAGVLRLVSIARVSPEKNTKYALQVLLGNTFDGNIAFDIFGPVYNKVYWDECLELIKLLPENIRVTYRGSIENTKVADTLQQYHALFLPTRGENFGHIILESFAAGRPVVTSNQTPWISLEERKLGYDLPLDKPSSFAGVLQGLLDQSQEEYDKFSEAAYIYAQQVCQDERALEQNRLLFK